MKTNSRYSNAVISAYDRGYRILTDGTAIGLLGKSLKQYEARKGYYSICVTYNDKPVSIAVHKLQAYQMFGDAIFGDGICIRHLNNNAKDNTPENIAFGSYSDNSMDILPIDRKQRSRKAAKALRVFSDDDIRDMRSMRKAGDILSVIGDKYGIGKGHVSDIVNKKLYDNVSDEPSDLINNGIC